jgi:transcriptional regulator with XRE-family HTH domain
MAKEQQKPWADEQLLRELYNDKDMTLSEIADELGCVASTISLWMDEFDIKRERYDPAKSGPWREYDTLKRLYRDEGLSRQAIADRFDVRKNTVNRWLRIHGLQKEIQSRKYGRLTMLNGYEAFIDYTGPDSDNDRVLMHRLLATVNNDLSEFEGKHAHHKIPVPWLNYRENVELLTPKEHMQRHK